MSTTLADAFDRIAHAEVFAERLERAGAELGGREGLADEARWLEDARRRIERAREGAGDLLTRALRLPEFSPMRDEGVRTLQGVAVDALEGVQRTIVAEAGDRSPLLEVLFRATKLPAMRRCGREEFDEFDAEMERRLTSTYVKRMLADASYAAVVAQVTEFRRAVEAWRGIFVPCGEEEAAVIRDALRALAEGLDAPSRQARALAEAAFVVAPDLREASGIFDKPKRRAARVVRAEAEGDASSEL